MTLPRANLAGSELAAVLAPRRFPEKSVPSRFSALVFDAKVAVFRARRLIVDSWSGPVRLAKGAAGEFTIPHAESRTPLWSDARTSERAMQLGKVHNLRRAARVLDGAVLTPGAVFSFWKQLGKTSRARGFATGRMLKEGCLVPATGGGLCQLSNALYDVALRAGCEIVERHGHSRLVPGSAAMTGRDATIAWNYVDLRFRSARPLMLRVALDRESLIVRLTGYDDRAIAERRLSTPEDRRPEAASCGDCQKTQCFRHETVHVPAGHRAYLVDDYWPEFERYIQEIRDERDVLCVPIDGARWKLERYRWKPDGFSQVRRATLQTLLRSWKSRRLAQQGPARRQAELDAADALAGCYATALGPEVTDVCITQSLLPMLWRDGHLAGRRFRVLMQRLPMAEIQARLDTAARAHPERKTLSDFRADPALIALESEALAAADAVVTPHTEIAALFGERAIKLNWVMPLTTKLERAPVPRRIAFVGPTIARKGAYELREAAKALDLEVVLLGSELEGDGFWNGVRVLRADGHDWMRTICAVVQPALLEEKPRTLLAARAQGIPVIATRACGLDDADGVTIVPESDVTALTAAIRRTI
ncbi:MAG: VanW family protein [Proteobacteria bacterium]|nr:VanW family protein [Pseudomonadota bacterium]